MPTRTATETDELRIDDLARAAGVASTTIRLYQSKGLLRPPRLVGRTGYYDAQHLDRLRVIARLQDDGFSLAGIAALLERWDMGAGLAELLGPRARGDLVLTAQELVELFPADDDWVENLQRAGKLGLVEVLEDGRLRIPDARFVQTGTTLAQLGVPLAAILDEWEKLTQLTDEMAERFAGLFEDHIVKTDWRSSLDASEVARLSGLLDELRDTSEAVVLAALDSSIAQVAERRFGELLLD